MEMIKVSRYQYWTVDNNINQNRYFKQFGDIYLTADISGRTHRTKDGVIVARLNKEGYFIHPSIENVD